jgi:hypothetical protein
VALRGFHQDVAAAAAVAARGATARYKFFAAEGHAAIAAVTGLHPDFGFVDKHADLSGRMRPGARNSIKCRLFSLKDRERRVSYPGCVSCGYNLSKDTVMKVDSLAASQLASKRAPVDWRSEEFLVLCVNPEHLTADLSSVRQARRPSEDVPWQSFLAIRRPKPEPLN